MRDRARENLIYCWSVTSVFGGMKMLKLEEIHLKLFVLTFHCFFLSLFYPVEWFVWRHWLNVFPPQATDFLSRFFQLTFPIVVCFSSFYFHFLTAVPWSLQSVGGLSPPTPTAVGFLVEKLALWQGFLQVQWFTLE